MPASTLVEDLRTIPSIVGGLGLSVAAAQKALNLDYLESVGRCLEMIAALPAPTGGADAARESAAALLRQLAPSRYQFTETSLTVRLDLAQRVDTSVSGKLGVAFGAVTVNAGFSAAYGYDYRAAAEVKATLHAYPADDNVFKALLARSKEIVAPALPNPTKVDTEIKDTAKKLVDAIVAAPAAGGGAAGNP